MTTGQNAGGIVDRPRALEMYQRGGQIYEATSYQSGQVLPRLSTSGGGVASQPQSITVVNQFTMPAEAVNDAFNGRTQTFINRNVRTVATATATAMRQNFGRQEMAAMLMSPTTVIT